MPDLSPSGLESLGFPSQTLDSLARGGDARVLGWLREATQEGDRINRSDPSYDLIEVAMAYVGGDQRPMTAPAQGQPSYLSNLRLNYCREAIQAHVSALTDLKPLFSYKAMDPAFTPQADLLNKLTVASWITNMHDVELGSTVKFSLAAGSGDMVVEWDPYAQFGGDIKFSARDPRDTLPIRPDLHNRSVQAWSGLMLRESHTVNAMRGLYPDHADKFRPTTDSLLSTLMGRFRQTISRLISPAADTLSGLNQPAMASRVRSGEILLNRTWLTDASRNLTSKPIPMGIPGTAWAYTVPPGGHLYPYKRMIISTPEFILYDGPSTYWHGQFPVNRLKLWDLPWHFLGRSLLHDLLPIQDGINQLSQDLMLGMRKWLDPAVKYDRSAVSENFMRTFDARRPGAKIKLNTQGAKAGFEIEKGPDASVLRLGLEMLDGLITKFHDLSGTPNLQQLLALRQLPGAETIQKYWEALTPELRQEGRAIEAFLRDVAEQMKVLRFQFESNARRVTILGDAGQTLQDFDFDPEVLVPSMSPDQPGYNPAFDASSTSRDQRAQAVAKKIVFTIAPNSILAMNATEQKLIRLQLARAGMYDFWSLCESLDIPNIGAPPAIPLPPMGPVDPQEAMQAILTPGAGKYVLDPASGRLMEIRQPLTVTERLMAQQQLGIGMAVNPAGRKASGQSPPATEQKGDGRTTVTESPH